MLDSSMRITVLDKQRLDFACTSWCLVEHIDLPVDTTYGCEVEGKKEPSIKYVDTMKERLKKAYELASRATRTAQERKKSGYEKKVGGTILQPATEY